MQIKEIRYAWVKDKQHRQSQLIKGETSKWQCTGGCR